MSKVSPIKSAKSAKVEQGVKRVGVSRTTKVERKLGGIGAKTNFDAKTAKFTVVGLAMQPVEIAGFIMSTTKTHVMFRHRATSASKKMKVSVFKRSNILELFGAEGKVSAIKVMEFRPFTEATGRISLNEDGSVTVTTDAKETVNFPCNELVNYQITALDDSNGAGTSAKSPSLVKKARA